MKRYLVLQLARLGDLLQSKRLVLTLEALGETHLAVDVSLEPIAGLIYPSAVIHPVRAHAGEADASEVFRHNLRCFTALRELDFEQVYNLNRNPLNLALAGLFEPERVVGYRLENGQPTGSLWGKMAVRWTGDRRSSPLNLMDFWAFFHPFPLAAEKVNPVARLKNQPGSHPGQRLGVVLAGRAARRSLPPSILAPVLEALFQGRKGPSFVLLGGGNEQASARLLLKKLPLPVQRKTEDLTGKTSLTDLPEIIRETDLLLTPDTGLMHLAAHLGTPVSALFLSSAWAWETGPYGLGHMVWQALSPCSPCLENAPCRRETACLKAFSSPAWLAHLAGKRPASRTRTEEPLGLVSGLDDLGATYLSLEGNAIPSLEERRARRGLLAAFLNLPPLPGASFSGTPETAPRLLEEKDWMLPDYGWRKEN
ncbi:MAG: glycosyltransferase family 9 protein [Deltaproteobacteria bacterium]|jgi:ADP-heptose:LPS heptosyltransferase|nr:glycosyltransferase family 9 protein [Deltaproteobacteria bacterium]